MKISFLLPGYPDMPIGGFRIVYQYGNYLVTRGHEVTIVHARRCQPFLDPAPAWPAELRRLWRYLRNTYRAAHPPLIRWQAIDPRVNLVFLPEEPTAEKIPDGDAIFATAWHTAPYVWSYPRRTGVPCYLIQHWETWCGSETEVGATWLLPMHKVVISQWLFDLGCELGASNVVHIPNAIDHTVFRTIVPLEHRPPSVVSLYHHAEWKGVADALAVLARLHAAHPEVPVTFFGAPPRGPELPAWIKYVQNPDQSVLVRDVYNEHSIYLSASWTEGWA
nr:glycosyltransferase family 4 protein [Thermaerobacter sp.]